MIDNIKIVWFVTNFVVAGGGEKWILEAQKVLSNYNIDTYIICNHFNKKALYDYSIDSLRIICLNPCKESSIKLSFFQKVFNYLTFSYRLRKTIKKIKPEIVISQNIKDHVLVNLALFKSGIRHWIKDDGPLYQIDDIKIRYSYFYFKKIEQISKHIKETGESIQINKLQMSFISKIINELKGALLYRSFINSYLIMTLSDKVRNECKTLYNHKNIKKIKGAFASSIFNYNSKYDIKKKHDIQESKIIFTVGRIVKHKRVDLLINAVNRIKDRIPNIKLLIGGKGPEFEKLQLLVKNHRLEKHVIFLGFIEESQLLDYYYACDVFAIMDPADFDITAYVALALGKKVVWPQIMELDDDIKNNRHIFSTIPKPNEIAEVLTKALNSEVNKNTDLEIEELRKSTWDSCFGKLANLILENTGVKIEQIHS